MLTTVLLPLFIACQTVEPPLLSVAKVAGSATMLMAGRRGGRRGPGPDHGDDPNDEQHDSDLPANQEKGKGRGSSDPYGGGTGNDKNHPFTPY